MAEIVETGVGRYLAVTSPSLSMWIDGKLYKAKNGVMTLPASAAKSLDEKLADPEQAHLNAHVRKMRSVEEAEKIVEAHRAAIRPEAARGALNSLGAVHPLADIPQGAPGAETSTIVARLPQHMIAPESGNAEQTHEINDAHLLAATLGASAGAAVDEVKIIEKTAPVAATLVPGKGLLGRLKS